MIPIDFKRILKKCADLFRLLEDIVCVGGMLLFGFLIIYEIIKRMLGYPGLPWLQEFSQYMFVISVFIGSSRAVETDDHMVMDMLYRTTPAKFHRPLQCFVDLFMLVLSIVLLKYSYQYWAYLNRMGTSVQSISSIKMATIWIPVVLSMFSMSVRYVFVFVRRVKAYVSDLRAHRLGTGKEDMS